MASAQDVSFKCICGQVEGTVEAVSASSVAHTMCYCKSCQTWAHSLDRADEVLDDQGASRIMVLSCARLKFDKGKDKLGVRRLSPKGPFRWYTKCCNTPVCNAMSGNNFGFVGMPSVMWKDSLPVPPDSVLGKPTVVNADGARAVEGKPETCNRAVYGRSCEMASHASPVRS